MIRSMGLVFFFVMGCGSSVNDSYCTVSKNSGKFAVMTCPDGSSVSLLSEIDESQILMRIDKEPSSEKCLNGGSVIHVGKDLDRDSQLSDSEITDTNYVCNEIASGNDTLIGNVVIENDLDVSLISQFTNITGDVLMIDVPSLMSIDLPNLQTIGGMLYIAKLPNLEKLNLPALESVGGHFVLDELGITELNGFPNLKLVGGVSVHDNQHLSECAIEALQNQIELANSDEISIHDNLNPCMDSACGDKVCVKDCSLPDEYLCE